MGCLQLLLVTILFFVDASTSRGHVGKIPSIGVNANCVLKGLQSRRDVKDSSDI